MPALVAILTTLMGLMITGLSVARERELGTFDQLLVSPLSPTEILIGKSVPALLIGAGRGDGDGPGRRAACSGCRSAGRWLLLVR